MDPAKGREEQLMRRTLALVVALAAVVPAVARAQEGGRPIATDTDPEPSEGGTPAAPEKAEPTDLDRAGDDRPKDFGGAASPEDLEGVKADHHVVQSGDTLWDISGRYMGNPWYWPKVWSYNPEIENPHWIYPGDDVRFYPDDGRGEEDGEKRDLDDVSKGDFNRPDYGEDDDVTTSGNIGYQGPRSLLTRHDGFVTERELAESATIEKAWQEKELLDQGDRIYLAWPNRNNVKVGEQYVIYRTQREIEHPVDGTPLGYVTEILGNARVVAADPKESYVTARIEKSFTEIHRGDYIGPAGARVARRITRKPNQISLAGRLVTSIEEEAQHFAPFHLVFIDKGRRDGVEEGNTFEVFRATDGLDYDGIEPNWDEELPDELIGRVMVVDTKETASSAVILFSDRELHSGDRVKMLQAKK